MSDEYSAIITLENLKTWEGMREDGVSRMCHIKILNKHSFPSTKNFPPPSAAETQNLIPRPNLALLPAVGEEEKGRRTPKLNFSFLNFLPVDKLAFLSLLSPTRI